MTQQLHAGATLGRALLREGDALFEAARLAARWRQLRNEPRGQGESVMVLPGFLTDDRTTLPLRTYLARMGYRASGWGLGMNRGDVASVLPRALAQIRAARDQAGAPVRLIGWSYGGIIAREAARTAPELVDRIITLGTPVRGPGHTVFARTFPAPDDTAQRLARRDAEQPITVPILALYSARDAIVYAEGAVDDASPNIEHVEVRCTHTGFGLSPEVYALIAERLR